jgi:CHAD domain-containing protein
MAKATDKAIRDSVRRLIGDRRVKVAAGAAAVGVASGLLAKALARRRGAADQKPSRAYRLKPEEGPVEGMRRVARGRAGKAAERLRKAQSAEDPAPCVHGARKDLKKLRSALRLLRHELGDDLYRAESSRYRDAGRLLSRSRDAEVKVEALEAICERYAGRLPAGAADEWLEQLRRERDRAVEAARGEDSAGLAQALELVEAGGERIDEWPLESEDWELFEAGIGRAYRRGRKRMRRAAADPSAEHIHEWRKRVKDLWYQLRILDQAIPEPLADRVEVLDRLASALGDHHDLAVLRDDLLVRDLPTVRRMTLVTAIEDRQQELATTAFALGERAYADKPKRFRKQMRSGWRRWRG